MNSFTNNNLAMPKIIAMALTIPVSRIRPIVELFCDILNFNVIYRSDSELVLHGPAMSKHLFIRLIVDDNKKILLSHDHLLVFYLGSQTEYLKRCNDLRNAGCKKVPSFNLYWDKVGSTFLINEDCRLVICHTSYGQYRSRIAMPTETENIKAISEHLQTYYALTEIDAFDDHEGFDGKMLSPKGLMDCHVEITSYRRHTHAIETPSSYSLSFITHKDNASTPLITCANLPVFTLIQPSQAKWVQSCVEQL